MSPADEQDATLAESAQQPAKVEGDSGSVEQHPLPDQIAVDRYLSTKRAVRSRKLGIRLGKIIPPGSE